MLGLKMQSPQQYKRYYWVTGRVDKRSLVNRGRYHLRQRSTQVGGESVGRHINSGTTTASSGGRAAAQPIPNCSNTCPIFKSILSCFVYFLACSRIFGGIQTFFFDLPIKGVNTLDMSTSGLRLLGLFSIIYIFDGSVVEEFVY